MRFPYARPISTITLASALRSWGDEDKRWRPNRSRQDLAWRPEGRRTHAKLCDAAGGLRVESDGRRDGSADQPGCACACPNSGVALKSRRCRPSVAPTANDRRTLPSRIALNQSVEEALTSPDQPAVVAQMNEWPRSALSRMPVWERCYLAFPGIGRCGEGIRG